MNQQKFILPFYVVTAIYLVAMFANSWIIQLIFKPLLVGSLLYYFIISTRNYWFYSKKRVVLALIFCILGDIFLSFSFRDELSFIFGLSAFLIGHIFYILTYYSFISKERISWKWHWIAAGFIYFSLSMYFISQHSAWLKIPVIAYATVITVMFILALHLLPIKHLGTEIAFGSALFVLSDTFIALDKFYIPIPHNKWIVMITYIAGQYLIVRGITRYIQYKKNKK